MNNFPYIWYLNYINNYEINLNNFNAYQQIYYENGIVNINLPYLGIKNVIKYNKKLINSYIKILSKISISTLSNPLDLISENKEYIIEKYKYKRKFTNDYIHIFKSCINEAFLSNIIYYNKKTKIIYIFLDYVKNEENIYLIENIIDNFLPLNFEAKYFFEHIYKLDREEFKILGEWLLL